MGAPNLWHSYTCIRIGRCRVYLRGEGLAWFLERHPEYDNAPQTRRKGSNCLVR